MVGLAKALTPAVDEGIAALGAPKAVVGIVIAAVVLMPEGLASLRAARVNRLQTAMNLALGSALATIGLTIPAVAAVSIVLGHASDARIGIEGGGAARTDGAGIRHDASRRTHHSAPGRRAPSDPGRLPVTLPSCLERYRGRGAVLWAKSLPSCASVRRHEH